MTDIKFFVLIRGAFTPAPRILTPVVWIPLKCIIIVKKLHLLYDSYTYTAAPTTERATDIEIPKSDHIYGEVVSKNLKIWEIRKNNNTICSCKTHQAMLTLSPFPVKTW